MKKGKTVFVLGAGFSVDAGAPAQGSLVEKMFEQHKRKKLNANLFGKFEKFLSETLLIPEINQNSVPLEDVFTPLDKCILEGYSFRNLSLERAVEMRSIVTNPR